MCGGRRLGRHRDFDEYPFTSSPKEKGKERARMEEKQVAWDTPGAKVEESMEESSEERVAARIMEVEEKMEKEEPKALFKETATTAVNLAI